VLLDSLDDERERIVEENDHFVAVVPYWTVWPFETLVIARREPPPCSAPTTPNEPPSAQC
jgi:galactose-1-phosphate uridylyltransferase